MSIKTDYFDQLPDGQPIDVLTLQNKHGMTAQVINYGATLISVKTPDKHGHLDEITLGFSTLKEYLAHEFYFGCVIGRVANRISNGQFSYGNKTYHLPINFIKKHHIHGGLKGFDKVLWKTEKMTTSVPSVKFSYLSPDGEEGYPGNLSISVTYTLTDNNELKLIYEASTDQPTPVDVTNHTYWNLAGAGKGTVLEHELQIAAEKYIVTDQNHIPSGEIRNVDNSAFDFKRPKLIKKDWAQLTNGYDLCYVLSPQQQPQTRFAARISAPDSGRIMEVYTNQNGLQFYTGNYLYDYPIANHRKTEQYGGFCVETQNFPDAVNHPQFPTPILLPEQRYFHETIFKFIN